MTTYRFIGTGVTDSNGVARLTKDPQGQTINGYTGSGVGEVDFIASLDNPIVDGSIVSETYQVYDYIAFDNAIYSDNHQSQWQHTDNKSTTTLPTDDSGTVITATSSELYNYFIRTIGANSNNCFTGDLAVEFDIVSVADRSNVRVQLSDGTNTSYANLLSLRVYENNHVLITVKNGYVRYYVNNNQYPIKIDQVTFTSAFSIGFRGQTDSVLKFKNFKVCKVESYPVIDGIYHDGGTSSDPTVSFWSLSNGSLNRTSEYTELNITSGQSSVMCYFNLINTSSFAIEFDAMFDCTDNNNKEIQFRNSSWTILRDYKLSDLTKDTWTHFKFVVKDGTITRYVDGTSGASQSISNASIFMIQMYTDDNYIHFKNFDYYPI